MKLLTAPPSPYARKIRVLLRETGMIDRVEEVEVITSPVASTADALSGNPMGKIPSLLRDDGPSIYDSRVISRYLDDIGNAGLYPERSLYEILTLEATADGIMDAAVGMVYETRLRPEPQQSPEWLDAQWGKAERAISTINSRWMSHLNGPLNAAQIATSCALAYLDLRHDARNWRIGNESLAAWQAEFETRPSMLATAPE